MPCSLMRKVIPYVRIQAVAFQVKILPMHVTFRQQQQLRRRYQQPRNDQSIRSVTSAITDDGQYVDEHVDNV